MGVRRHDLDHGRMLRDEMSLPGHSWPHALGTGQRTAVRGLMHSNAMPRGGGHHVKGPGMDSARIPK